MIYHEQTPPTLTREDALTKLDLSEQDFADIYKQSSITRITVPALREKIAALKNIHPKEAGARVGEVIDLLQEILRLRLIADVSLNEALKGVQSLLAEIERETA